MNVWDLTYEELAICKSAVNKAIAKIRAIIENSPEHLTNDELKDFRIKKLAEQMMIRNILNIEIDRRANLIPTELVMHHLEN
jgi:hypothetical protein